MNFSRRLATTTDGVRGPNPTDTSPAPIPIRQPVVFFLRSKFSVRCSAPVLAARRDTFSCGALLVAFSEPFFRVPRRPPKKKKGCAPARRERSVRMRAAGQGRHAV